jgi:hypothetical protein
VGEQEVEGSATALVEDGREEIAERLAADEEDQRLVLVGRPVDGPEQEERREAGRDRSDAQLVRPLGDPAHRSRSGAFGRQSLGARVGERRVRC